MYGEERYEKVSFQKEVMQQFEQLQGKEWLTVDASRDIATIHAQVLEDTVAVISRCATQPISKLWINSS